VRKIKLLGLCLVVFLSVITLYSSIKGETSEEEKTTDLNEETQKEAIVDETVAPISVLASNEIVVYTYAELKDALQSSTNGIDYIYLGSDITLEISGISVSNTKSNVTLDGTYNGIRHTLIEGKSAAITTNIYINSASMNTFTLKNMDVFAYNYYGTIKVADTISDVTLIYDNLVYNGPQITHNPNGHAVYKDTTINIQNNGISAPQEVAEIANVDFYGNVEITQGNAYHIFYLYKPSTFTFHEHSNVRINANTNPMFYNSSVAIVMDNDATFNYYSTAPKLSNLNHTIRLLELKENATFDLHFNGIATLDYATRFSGDVVIGENANFNITTQSVISTYLIYGTSSNNWILNGGNVNIETNANVNNVVSANSIIINRGLFSINNFATQAIGVTLIDGIRIEREGSYKQYSNQASSYSFNTTGNGMGIQVQGGYFHIEAKNVSAQYLMGASSPFSIDKDSSVYVYTQSGPATALIYMSGNGYIDINDPKSVVFYSPQNRMIQYSGTRPLQMIADQINIWSTNATPGYQSWNPPQSFWNKQEDELYKISGNLAAGIAGVYTITSTNYEANDGSNGNPKDLFVMNNLKVLSLGRLSLSIDPIFVQQPTLSGTSVPNAIIKITYNGNEQILQANDQGGFETTLTNLQIGDRILVEANNQYYLYQKESVMVEDFGGLSFKDVPSAMNFHSTNIPSSTTLINRQLESWSIQVEDERAIKNNWKLFASLEQPYMDANNEKTNNLQLVYVDENNNEKSLTQDPLLIYDAQNKQDITNISWLANQGILTKFIPGLIFKDSSYRATITWTLQDAP